MEPLVHLKKQSRKLTDSLASLQDELKLAEMRKNPTIIPLQTAPAPPLTPQKLPVSEAADDVTRTP
jgi:hypothetical protein